MKCINTSNLEFKQLVQDTGLPSYTLEYQVSKWMDEKKVEDFPSSEEILGYIKHSNDVNYSLKVVQALSKPNAQSILDKGIKNKWGWWKICEALGIPKAQIDFLTESYNKGNTIVPNLITDILATYSYTVKINKAEESVEVGEDEEKAGPNEWYSSSKDKFYKYTDELGYLEYDNKDGSFVNSPLDKLPDDVIESGWDTISIPRYATVPSQHYYNLTVPGGTNYTENEIKTPGIEPSMQGHAQFSTKNGIGWFRSDEAIEYTSFEEVTSIMEKSGILKIKC